MMNQIIEIPFCFLDDYENLQEALGKVFGLSKSNSKKLFDNKKKLRQKIFAKREYNLDLNVVNHLMINPVYKGEPLEILFENDKYLVMNKMPGIHCHPYSYGESDNCLSFLRHNNYGKLLEINKCSYDRGLLYRLDQVTSGLLVYVKDEQLLHKLKNNFEAFVYKKIYFAIVQGKFEQSKRLTHYFVKSEIKGRKIKVFENELEHSKEGICLVEPIKFDFNNNITLIRIELKTGLRHQIRAQLSYIGFPILGDELYGGKAASRVYLHAYHYSIGDLDNSLNVFSSKAFLFDSFFDLNTCL